MEFDREIFKYPAVEYIPLYPYTLGLEPNWASGRPDQVTLYVLQDQAAFAEELARLGITYSEPVDFSRYLVLITLGYEITGAWYRGYLTILLGNPLPGGYHIARIPRWYFYKDRIHFALYSDEGKKLTWTNIGL
ncbi:MAG: hypothetical protein ACOX2S_07130 [bacterium]|jgi:hypothetical protein